jgi:integrase
VSDDKKLRRSRGEGGLHWNKKRRRWIATAHLGYGADGKRITKTGSGRTKTEAKDKLKEVLRDYEDGLAIAPSDYTVKDAVEDWLRFGLSKRSAKTVEVNEYYCRVHVIPSLGARKLRELSAADVEKWLEVKAKTLSTRVLQGLHSALNRSVRRAMARDKVKRNVVELCTIPEGQAGRPSKSLTMAQARAVLTETAAHRMHCYIVVSLLTGARTEELRALTWDHVDLVGDPDASPPVPPHVAVWRSVRKGGDTKTRKSRRTLALPDRCVTLLEQHRRDQDLARQQDELDEWHDNDLVFATVIGTAMDATNVRRDFRAALKLVPDINPDEWTPRELRHSFVSVLSAHGVSIEEISQLVGHRSTAVTEVVYRHELRPVIQRGAVVMNDVFKDVS